MLLGMISYKAEEAGCRFVLSETKRIKPTQRCAVCGKAEKKELGQRLHECSCGFVASRDRNSALVCLIDAVWPDHDERLSKGQPPLVDGYASLIRGRLEEALREGLELKSCEAKTRGPETVLEPEMEAILF